MSPLKNEGLNQLIDEIIKGLSLEERVLVANMKDLNADVMQQVLDLYIRSKIGDDAGDDHTSIMTILWERVERIQG